MLIIGLDFETTGLNPQEELVTEIGAVAWDVGLKTPVSFFHRFLKIDRPLTPEIIELTGITDVILEKYGIPQEQGFVELERFMQKSEIAVAQNAPFDKSFLDAGLARFHMKTFKKWIDTAVHVPYPKRIRSKNLINLAAEHGFLNPFPHRAVTDVLTMLTVLSKYDFLEVLEASQEPTLKICARVTFAEKEKAKGAGFYYDGNTKKWYKNIRQKELETEQNRCALLGFVIEVIKDEQGKN